MTDFVLPVGHQGIRHQASARRRRRQRAGSLTLATPALRRRSPGQSQMVELPHRFKTSEAGGGTPSRRLRGNGGDRVRRSHRQCNTPGTTECSARRGRWRRKVAPVWRHRHRSPPRFALRWLRQDRTRLWRRSPRPRYHRRWRHGWRRRCRVRSISRVSSRGTPSG